MIKQGLDKPQRIVVADSDDRERDFVEAMARIEALDIKVSLAMHWVRDAVRVRPAS